MGIFLVTPQKIVACQNDNNCPRRKSSIKTTAHIGGFRPTLGENHGQTISKSRREFRYHVTTSRVTWRIMTSHVIESHVTWRIVRHTWLASTCRHLRVRRRFGAPLATRDDVREDSTHPPMAFTILTINHGLSKVYTIIFTLVAWSLCNKNCIKTDNKNIITHTYTQNYTKTPNE